MEDKELVIRAQKGERQAFGLLYQKYFQKIFRFCKFNTKNEEVAKDITQETFVKAYKKLPSFSTDGKWSIQSFLFTIARNLIIDLSRKKKEANIEDFENLESNENIYDEIEQQENMQKVREVLARLEDFERQIVILRYFEELPFEEVAKILGVNNGALRVRTHRVLAKMKVLFTQNYGKRN